MFENVYKLDRREQRPVIRFDFMELKDCIALVDTGATIPVWTSREEDLVTLGAI